MLLLLASVLFATSSAAGTPTLADIGQRYAQKQETLGAFEMEYREITETHEAGKPVRITNNVKRWLNSDSGYRIELSVVDIQSGQPVPFVTVTDNGDQHRSLTFDAMGKPAHGSIAGARPHDGVYQYTPVGLAGLHDTSNAPGAGTAEFLSDIRALAQDSRTRLVEEPVSVDGEAAYLLEWPKEGEHPMMRFWLSADKGLALLKYESYDRSAGNRTSTRVRNSEFLEAVPGVFLPQHSEFSVLPAPPDNSRQTVTVQLMSHALNTDVSPTDLRLAFPEGLPVHDQRLGFDYKMGMAANIKDVRHAATRILSNSPGWVQPLLAILFLVCAFAVFGSLRALRRRKRAGQSH